MASITSLDRKTVQALREEIDSALAKIGEKHNISAELGRGSFSINYATFKLEIAVKDVGGKIKSREYSSFVTQAVLYNLSPTDIDKTIEVDGVYYIIRGLKPGRGKYPIVIEREHDQKMFKMPAETARLALEKMKAEEANKSRSKKKPR